MKIFLKKCFKKKKLEDEVHFELLSPLINNLFYNSY